MGDGELGDLSALRGEVSELSRVVEGLSRRPSNRAVQLYVEKEVGEARERLDGLADAVGRITGRLEKLAGSGDAGGPDGDGPVVWHWLDLTEAQQAQVWPRIVEWVDTVLLKRCGMPKDKLLSCWDRHPRLVDAVVACWQAFEASHHGKQARGQDPAQWRSRDLPALVKEIGQEFHNGQCRDQSHRFPLQNATTAPAG